MVFFTSCNIDDDIINDYQEPSITIDEKNSGSPIPSELTISESYDFSEVYSIKYLNDVGELKKELITWESSDISILTINNQGLATAVNSGEVTISVSATNDNPNGENTKITKEVATIRITSVPEVLTVTNPIKTLSIDEKFTFKTAYFNNAGNQDNTVSLVWESTAPEIASISNTGEITGKSKGTSEITVKTATNSIATTFTIKVNENISMIRINNPLVANLKIGRTHQYEYSYFDENGAINTSNTINWESSNTQIATISNNGLITAISPGSTTITATTIENGTTITSLPTTVTTSNNTLSINEISSVNIGDTHQYTVNFEGTTPITWNSSDVSVATISSNGFVTAVAAGDTTITATTVEGGKTIMATTNLEIKGGDSKSGTLSGSYSLAGTVNLTSTRLSFMNFVSTAPDTHIYLTNNSGSIANGMKVSGSNKVSGSSFSLILNNIDINDYGYVVAVCQGAGNLILGAAQLN